MIKKSLFIATLTFSWTFSISQSIDTIASLHYELAIAKDDTSRINALLAMSYEYRLGNADSAIFYGKQALDQSKKTKYAKGEALACGFIAIASHQIGNIPQALAMGFESLRVADANNLENYKGAALN